MRDNNKIIQKINFFSSFHLCVSLSLVPSFFGLNPSLKSLWEQKAIDLDDRFHWNLFCFVCEIERENKKKDYVMTLPGPFVVRALFFYWFRLLICGLRLCNIAEELY